MAEILWAPKVPFWGLQPTHPHKKRNGRLGDKHTEQLIQRHEQIMTVQRKCGTSVPSSCVYPCIPCILYMNI